MKEISLVWTRDFTLAWAEWWSRDMSPRLAEVFGVGVPNQLSYFNGRLLETYRLSEEAKGFIQAVVNSDLKLLGEDKIDAYIKTIKNIRDLIGECERRKNFTDINTFEKLKQLSSESYPWYTVSYLLPQAQWASVLKEKYPIEAPQILEQLIEARKKSEGTTEELVEYWRTMAKVLLAKHNISDKFAPFILFRELERMLVDDNYAPDLKEIEARSEKYIFVGDSVYTGISKEDFFNQHGFVDITPATSHVLSEVSGTVSCLGSSSIKGEAQIILRNEEIANFKPGNILVTVMTNPYFIPIMKKAGAIVTDEGGITCHASIVSRELNIPCITGTRCATKIFNDGDIVEVDALNGIVKKL